MTLIRTHRHSPLFFRPIVWNWRDATSAATTTTTITYNSYRVYTTQHVYRNIFKNPYEKQKKLKQTQKYNHFILVLKSPPQPTKLYLKTKKNTHLHK